MARKTVNRQDGNDSTLPVYNRAVRRAVKQGRKPDYKPTQRRKGGLDIPLKEHNDQR